MNESDDFEEQEFQDEFPSDDFEEDSELPSDLPKERSIGEKAVVLPLQVAAGVIEASPAGMAYNTAVAPLSNFGSQYVNYRENLFEDIEQMAEQKATGVWSDEDENLYNSLLNQVKNPETIDQFVKTTPDLTTTGILSSVTGLDLHPRDFTEKAANWIGYLRSGNIVKDLPKVFSKPTEFLNSMIPTTKEFARSIGAGLGYQMALNGQFGPVGTIAAEIGGDLAIEGTKGIVKAATNPVKTAAQITNFLTRNNTGRQAAAQLAEDFSKAGLTIDAGTLTNANFVKMMQTRLSQSGLTGEPLDNLRKELSQQFVREYEAVIGDLGDIAFETNYQASEAIKNALTVNEELAPIAKQTLNRPKGEAGSLRGRVNVQEQPTAEINFLDSISPSETTNTALGGRSIKEVSRDIRQPIKRELNQRWDEFHENVRETEAGPQSQLADELTTFIETHQGSLLLGEHAPEAQVLQTARNLLRRLRTEEGALHSVSLDELIKTKRTLGGIANWEMAGSDFESAYKRLVSDVDNAIERELGRANPSLLEDFNTLNRDYTDYKNIFEDKNLRKVFNPKDRNYNAIYAGFEQNPDKLAALERVLSLSEEGNHLLNQIKRDYADRILSRPNLTERELRDLQQALGNRFDPEFLEYMIARQNRPPPRAAIGQPLNVNAQLPQQISTSSLSGRNISKTGTSAAKLHTRKTALKALDGKSPEQIMNMMSTPQGIRKLREALNTTAEGKKVFKQIARYKLAEIIDKKMMEGATNQLSLAKFSKLLSDSKSKEVVQELLGSDALKHIQFLQSNAGKLYESTSKFLNASQSGIASADIALMGNIISGITGIFTGNPFMFLIPSGILGGSNLFAKLLSNKTFLKELETLVKNSQKKNPKDLQKTFEKLMPIILDAQQQQREEQWDFFKTP